MENAMRVCEGEVGNRPARTRVWAALRHKQLTTVIVLKSRINLSYIPISSYLLRTHDHNKGM